jgi:YfiH family protein
METITETNSPLTAGFSWRESNGVRVLTSDALSAEGFVNGFSTRLGGVSPMPEADLNLAGFADDDAANIYENRRRFLGAFDGHWTLTSCWQVHGNDVRVVHNEDDAGNDEERCDALTSALPGIMLGVKTADCVPVLLGDPRTGAAAAVHAGWRGTLATIVPVTIGRMAREFGTRPEDLCVAIGPAAASCCYEVGHEVVDLFNQNFAYAGELFEPTHARHAVVDLQRANRQQLIDAGVYPSRIQIANLCTICRTDLFFSYRKEKHTQGKTGRLMSVIGKVKAETGNR